MSVPAATARLQFHAGFGFEDAIAIAPYLSRLGISHVYASPIFTARSGSSHGYDITDANTVNPELGGRNGLARLRKVLRQHDIGLILDIVPNHMASAAPENAWFTDVLKWGRSSQYADYFDINWDNDQPQLNDKMLLPILARPYAEVLQSQEISVIFDRGRGEFMLAYFDRRLPLAAATQPAIFAQGASGATDPVDATKIPAEDIARAVAAFDSSSERGRERLHQLLEEQHYRLAFWQNAADEINWRRFFEISDLIGVKVEHEHVFEASHALIFELYRDGLIDGVRVDHVDGLAFPEKYCRQLRSRLSELHALRPAPLDEGQPLVWVEKILAEDEALVPQWQTDGTTGYEFINDVLRVLIDAKGEGPLTQFWQTASANQDPFDVYETLAREQILSEHLAGEFERLCGLLNRLSNLRIETRDITGVVIRRALYALLVNFRVYRIYARPGQVSPADLATLVAAAANARRLLRPADHAALDALIAWFSGAFASAEEESLLRTVLVRLEQLSAPLAAKAVEDTAFYRYGRLLALNEVGGSPGRFGLTTDEFHARMQARCARSPLGLSPLSTHDHKRGADSRARLAVLSQHPEVLGQLVRDIATALEKTSAGDAQHISASDLLMLLQSLVGAWPLSLAVNDMAGCEELKQRLVAWQHKALREAKQHSDWLMPATEYEALANRVLDAILDEAGLRSVVYKAVERIAAAGAANSLAQVVLQCTAPGIPDIYQGTEMWDFSLVDPDNRRPVDYVHNANALDLATLPQALLPSWRDGRVKQALVARLLRWRRGHADFFATASYAAITPSGRHADRILAFARAGAEGTLVTVVPRTVAEHVDAKTLIARKRAWGRTTITVTNSASSANATWTDLVSGSTHRGETLRIDALLSEFPVACLFLPCVD